MGAYIPSTGEERQAMLQAIGLTSTDQLFDVVPEAVRVKNLDLPEGLSEWEVSEKMARPGREEPGVPVGLRGAGAYRHYIPAIVKTVTSKEEFLTAYTPLPGRRSARGCSSPSLSTRPSCASSPAWTCPTLRSMTGRWAPPKRCSCARRAHRGHRLRRRRPPRPLAVIQTYCEPERPRHRRRWTAPPTPPPLQAVLAGDMPPSMSRDPNYFGVLEDMDAIVASPTGRGQGDHGGSTPSPWAC